MIRCMCQKDPSSRSGDDHEHLSEDFTESEVLLVSPVKLSFGKVSGELKLVALDLCYDEIRDARLVEDSRDPSL